MPPRIYLDNNATTRPHPEVIEAMARHFHDSYANPGSRHAEGRIARQALEAARETVAAVLGADPSEVIFTSGGTEATNIAIFGLLHRPIKGGQGSAAPPARSQIALTAGEHPATMETCRWLEQYGWRRHLLDVDADGRLLTDQYERLPWSELALATVILAHNETGVIQELQPLTDLCRRHGVPLHVDAVQAIGKIPVHFHDLGAATLSLGAHKFHGPRGVGALLLRDGVTLAPTQFGGHQESGRRPGTEPVALAVGMAKALELWQAEYEPRMRRMRDLRDRLEQGLQAGCPPVVVNGARQQRLPNTANVAFPGLDGEALLVALDLEGVACSLGSTCASGSAEPAPVLVAMGCPPEIYRASVRFSVSCENSAAEIDDAVQRIVSVVNRLRRL